MDGAPISRQALNRALLARQGLLDRLAAPVADVVAAVGALQMQYWPALVAALWSRMADCSPSEPYQAHDRGELVTGTLLRGTIHTVTVAEYPAYAAVAAASKVGAWLRVEREPGPGGTALERDLLAFATEPRTADALIEFAESWVDRHPGAIGDAELAEQRRTRWRSLRSRAWMLRAPADGRWGARTPRRFRTAPQLEAPPLDEAMPTVVRCHLRAFGPAAVEDIASWIAWNRTPVQQALDGMDGLVTFTDETDRVVYDLPDAPRPDPGTEAPVRLLPWFDSTLLAYAPDRRERLLPREHRDAVYVKVNGQLKPTFLVDGRVAGLWSVATERRVATLTLTPLGPLASAPRQAVLDEAQGMVRMCQPEARAYDVRLEG